MKTRTSTPKATADTIERLSNEVDAVRSIAGGFNNPSARRPTYVDTVAALKAVSVGGIPDGATFITKGYYASGDGGGATYHYSSSSSATDDGGSVIAPTSGSGRYLLQFTGVVEVMQFGAKGDGATNDATALNNAATYARTKKCGVHLPRPATAYLVTSTVDFRDLPLVEMEYETQFTGGAIRATTAIVAVRLGGTTSTNITGGSYKLKVEGNTSAWQAGSVGVEVDFAQGCEFDLCVSGYEKGLLLSPTTGQQVTYNKFNLRILGYNKTNISLEASSTGYVNANQFIGGALILAAVGGTNPIANVALITTGSGMVQDNVFREIDFAATSGIFPTAALFFWTSADGGQYGTNGTKAVNCRAEVGAGVLVPVVIVTTTTNKRLVDIDIEVSNVDFTDYTVTVPENETHHITFRRKSAAGYMNESNEASNEKPIVPPGLAIPLYTDGNSIYGNLRAPNRVIYSLASSAIVQVIATQSIGGAAANTGFSACGELTAGIAGGAAHIVGQRYTKNTDKSVWLRLTDGVDCGVVCFNAAGSIISGTSPRYAQGKYHNSTTVGSTGMYRFKGGWLWLHKDVASFILGYYNWSIAGAHPYKDLVIESTAGAAIQLDSSQLPQSIMVSSGVPKFFARAGTVVFDISGTARYQNSKELSTTLAANGTFGATSITVTDATGIAAGDTIGWQHGYSAAGIAQWQTAVVSGVVGNVVSFGPTTIYSGATTGQRVRVAKWTTF